MVVTTASTSMEEREALRKPTCSPQRRSSQGAAWAGAGPATHPAASCKPSPNSQTSSCHCILPRLRLTGLRLAWPARSGHDRHATHACSLSPAWAWLAIQPNHTHTNTPTTQQAGLLQASQGLRVTAIAAIVVVLPWSPSLLLRLLLLLLLQLESLRYQCLRLLLLLQLLALLAAQQQHQPLGHLVRRRPGLRVLVPAVLDQLAQLGRAARPVHLAQRRPGMAQRHRIGNGQLQRGRRAGAEQAEGQTRGVGWLRAVPELFSVTTQHKCGGL